MIGKMSSGKMDLNMNFDLVFASGNNFLRLGWSGLNRLRTSLDGGQQGLGWSDGFGRLGVVLGRRRRDELLPDEDSCQTKAAQNKQANRCPEMRWVEPHRGVGPGVVAGAGGGLLA